MRKSERWFDSEKAKFGCLGILGKPWGEFPDNPAVYEWEEKDKRKWLEEIWIPTWNRVSEEERDAYFAYVYSSKQFDTSWLYVLNSYSIENPDKLENYFHRLGFLQESEYDWDTHLINPLWKQFPKLLDDKNGRNKDFAVRWLKESWMPLWNNMSENEQNRYAEYLNKYAGQLNHKWMQLFGKHEVKNLLKLDHRDKTQRV